MTSSYICCYGDDVNIWQVGEVFTSMPFCRISNTGVFSKLQVTPLAGIYENGCLDAAKLWINRNLVPVAGVVVAVALLQVSMLTLF